MPIIIEKEKELRKKVIEILNLNVQSFKNIAIFSQKRKNESAKKIFDLNKKLSTLYFPSIEKVSSAFAAAPLGKDLRRNVCYLFMIRDLMHIFNQSISITKFVQRVCEDKFFDLKWVKELSNKIERRLILLKKLIEKEDEKIIKQIEAKDTAINDFYKELVLHSLDLFENSKNQKKTMIEKNRIVSGYIVTSKNFEIIGDTIKEIAQLYEYIFKGHFKHGKNQ